MSQPKLSLRILNNKKNDCCQARLQPLVQRIQDLQTQLKLEIERREQDYNDLLRLVVKEKLQNTGVKSLQTFVCIKQRKSKVEKSPQLLSKKQKVKDALKRRVYQRIIQQKDKDHKKANQSGITIQEKTKLLEQGLEHQQVELHKMKELNEYLMEQMLLIFEKIKALEAKEQATLKQIQSLETFSSIVVQTEARQEHIKIVNNLNNTKKPDLAHFELSALALKVAEHQNVLSELMQLIREMSLLSNSSPKKPQQMLDFND